MRIHLLLVLILCLLPIGAHSGPIFPFEVRITTRAITASNVPLSFRAVPEHPDDGGMALPAIEPDSISIPSIYSIASPGYGFKKLVGDHIYKIGLRLELNLNKCGTPDSFMGALSGIRERNYAGGTKRGSGTALTYYGLSVKDWIVPEFITEYQKDNICFGMTYKSYNLRLENGWDRYNRLQRWQAFNAGKMNMYNIYVGLNKFRLGYSINSHSGATAGAKMSAKNFFTIAYSENIN